MSNVIEPYDPTVNANDPDLYYYTDMATNG